MSTDTAIYESLVGILQDWLASISPEYPVAYPGVGFTPPDSGEWLEVRWFPNETLTYGLGAPPYIYRGFLQVAACGRPGAGIRALTDLAGAVCDAFAPGVDASPALLERRPWASSLVEMPDRLMVPVTIPYRAMVGA